jgi:predicted Abi (CAAX) family protease
MTQVNPLNHRQTLNRPQPPKTGEIADASAPKQEMDPKKSWLPTYEWAGRLILPKPEDRRDGGVFFKVSQAPKGHAGMKGKMVWLKFEEQDWVDRVTTDVDFSKRTEKGKDKGWQHPDRVDGWDDVSPLESLAGARAKDDMVVGLKEVRLSNGNLLIEREPVQISGTNKALVTFEKKLDNHTWQVRHWNSETNDFSGPKEVIKTTGRDDLAPMKDRKLNRKGWYLFGDPGKNGKMEVSALEPRALFQAGTTDQAIAGHDEAYRFLAKDNWRMEEQQKGTFTKTLVKPEKPEANAPTEPLSEQMNKAFQVGDKGILLHLFGGAVGAPATLGLYLGHFAFGLAEVVKDPFTGEAKFDVEYKQIYAHNRGGIVSGSQSWQTYMGDTERGLVYDRPVSDSFVELPEFYDDSKGDDPSRIFEDRMAEMTARYRSGHGDGASIVTSAQNCSQDSSQALYATVSDWKKAMADGTIGTELSQFAEDVAGHITPFFGWAPRAWRRTAANKTPKKRTLRWLPALKAPKTIIPRQNHEGLSKMALDGGREIMVFKTDVIGADNPETIPTEPVRNINPFD